MASDFRLKEQLPDLTDRIVETYSSVGTINHLGHCPLPKMRCDLAGADFEQQGRVRAVRMDA